VLEKDVPQEQGIAEGLKEVCYAVGENGKYVLAPSSGWEPKNIANGQAWELLEQQLEEARQKVLAGKSSPLDFYMAKNQMDVRLLSQYSGFFCWQIRRHLKPAVFARLKPEKLARYAALFKISAKDLIDMDLIRRV
jgi:hypothetical protein